MARHGIRTEFDMWELDDGLELRLWASYRGQTLARTVRGMMYYHRLVPETVSGYFFQDVVYKV